MNLQFYEPLFEEIIKVFYILYCINICLVRKAHVFRYNYVILSIIAILFVMNGVIFSRNELYLVYIIIEACILIATNFIIYFIYEGSVIKKLSVFTAAHGTITISIFIIKKVAHLISTTYIMENDWLEIVLFAAEMSLIIIILFFCSLLFKNQFLKLRKIDIKYNRVISNSIVIYYIIIGSTYLYLVPELREERLSYLTVLIFFIIVVAGVMEYMLNKELINELDDLVKVCEQQNNYYLALQRSVDKTRKLKHDIASHLNMIKMVRIQSNDLANSNDMSLLTEEVKGLSNINSKMLVTLIRYYQESCKKHEIHMEVNYRFTKEIPISEYELITVCKNLLENAWEACMNDKEKKHKYILIRFYQSEDNMVIEVENSKSERQVALEKLSTIKEDKELHGLGLKIIQDICLQHEGHLEYKDSNNNFFVKITL